MKNKATGDRSFRTGSGSERIVFHLPFQIFHLSFLTSGSGVLIPQMLDEKWQLMSTIRIVRFAEFCGATRSR